MAPISEIKVAYVLKGFPRLSETFIANEIRILERLGVPLRLFSIKRGETDKVHAMVSAIEARIDYLPPLTSLSGTPFARWLTQNIPKVWSHHCRLLSRRKAAYLRTLLKAVRMSWTYRTTGFRPRKVFIKEFLQAGDIAARILEDPSIRHVHGHFCHGAATVTWFVSLLTELPFSFTAHAKDIYVGELNPGDLLERKMSAARFVVTCTRANECYLQQKYPHVSAVYTIYHGLDVQYFRPSAGTPSIAEPPIILSVGRFVEKKGFSYLVEACARLNAAGISFKCMIIGEHGDQLPVISRMIEALSLEGKVELRGAVTQDELKGLYRQAAVFALPCHILDDGDRDGIPNVMAEAMASGLPIVSSAISGIPELISDGVEGFLVPQRDSAALSSAIRSLLESPELRREMGKKARERVCDCFDSHKTTIALRNLFFQALSMEGQSA